MSIFTERIHYGTRHKVLEKPQVKIAASLSHIDCCYFSIVQSGDEALLTMVIGH